MTSTDERAPEDMRTNIPAPAFRPEQLPAESNGNPQFIAYGPEERVADPDPDNPPLTVRPQVYVRYYHNIGVKRFLEGGVNGDREGLVTVEFDPQTVGLEKPIRAHVDADEPVLQFLRSLQANGEAASVGIETTRKKKSSETKDPIGPLRPIHGLRGAANPDGSGDHHQMMGPSGANTSNKLAMVNGRPTKHLASNAAEWRVLTNNKAGDLPPEGWKYYGSKEDWTKVGAIIPDGNAPAPSSAQQPAAGGSMDVQALVRALGPGLTAVIQQAVSDEFAKQSAAEATEDQMKGRPRGRGFSEGKPWQVRTSDGRVNLGTYMVTNTGYSMRWAMEYLADDTGHSPVAAQDLANIVLHLADRTQADAYGHGVEPDRCATSHREATRWVQWVITHEQPVPVADTGDVDQAVLTEWQDKVVRASTQHMAASGEVVAEYLTSRSNAKKDAEPKATEDEPQQTGPAPHVVGALLKTATSKWTDLQVIGNVGTQVREREFSDLVVSLGTDENGGPALHYPAVEGEESGALGDVLRNRWIEVKDAQGKGGGTLTQQTPPTTVDEAVPEQDVAPTTAAPEETPSPNEPGTPEADPVVEAFINRVKQTASLDQVKTLFQKAQKQNFLATRINVKEADDGSLTYDTAGTAEGFESWTAAQVLEHLRGQFDTPAGTDTPAAPADTAPATDGSSLDETAQQLADKATATVAKHREGELDAADARKELSALMSAANKDNLQRVEVSSSGRKGGLRSLLTHLMKNVQD